MDNSGPYRIGNGFDAHAFGADRALVLGGVPIPDLPGLDGHSDADVVIHALMDAMLGALSLGDIGGYFPDSDPQYKGASSLSLLKTVYALVADHGFRLNNADITVICEQPKISAFRQAMIKTLATTLEVDLSVLSIKGTTTEGMGFTGRHEGIACQAIVLLISD